MKIFDKDSKINFVDENNVFVGYDMGQDCCELADWFISEKAGKNIINEKEVKNTPDILEYSFDAQYFQEVDSPDVDEGRMVRFKLVAKDKPDLYLHIFNAHNGYYGHGFEATINDQKWQEGCL